MAKVEDQEIILLYKRLRNLQKKEHRSSEEERPELQNLIERKNNEIRCWRRKRYKSGSLTDTEDGIKGSDLSRSIPAVSSVGKVGNAGNGNLQAQKQLTDFSRPIHRNEDG